MAGARRKKQLLGGYFKQPQLLTLNMAAIG